MSKFEIGQWVKIISERSVDYGVVGRIQRIEGDHYKVANSYWYTAGDLEPAPSAPAPTGAHPDFLYEVGDFHVVKDGDDYIVEFADGDPLRGNALEAQLQAAQHELAVVRGELAAAREWARITETNWHDCGKALAAMLKDRGVAEITIGGYYIYEALGETADAFPVDDKGQRVHASTLVSGGEGE